MSNFFMLFGEIFTNQSLRHLEIESMYLTLFHPLLDFSISYFSKGCYACNFSHLSNFQRITALLIRIQFFSLIYFV